MVVLLSLDQGRRNHTKDLGSVYPRPWLPREKDLVSICLELIDRFSPKETNPNVTVICVNITDPSKLGLARSSNGNRGAEATPRL